MRQQFVGLLDIDKPPKEVSAFLPLRPGRVILESTVIGIKQEDRRPRVGDRLMEVPALGNWEIMVGEDLPTLFIIYETAEFGDVASQSGQPR